MDFQLIDPKIPQSEPCGLDSSRSLINPLSGLANDYLNLFNELVMILEQLPQMPELIEDLLLWRPVSYRDYFLKSRLAGSRSALEAYDRVNPSFKRRFETMVQELDVVAVAAVASARRHFRDGEPKDIVRATATCERAAEKMRIILIRASRLVNYANIE